MKLVSWNVNGLRAVLKKGFEESFAAFEADVVCLQEVKMQEGQAELALDGYEQFWHCAEKKGYSGVAVFSKQKPLSWKKGIGVEKFDCEGRTLTLEFEQFYFVGAYVPNAQDGLKRIDYRCEWEDCLRAYLLELNQHKPVVYCGDLNVAHNEIDLENPESNHKSPGFSDAERAKFTELLEAGFVDTFRHFEPNREKAYTWWSYRTRARERNVGWRIDYFVTSNALTPKLKGAGILAEVMGSDHCPVWLEVEA